MIEVRLVIQVNGLKSLDFRFTALRRWLFFVTLDELLTHAQNHAAQLADPSPWLVFAHLSVTTAYIALFLRWEKMMTTSSFSTVMHNFVITAKIDTWFSIDCQFFLDQIEDIRLDRAFPELLAFQF